MSDKQPARSVPLYLPSDRAWFDPLLLIKVTAVVPADVAVAAGAPVKLAVPNPMRLMIGFMLQLPAVATVTVAPWPKVDQFQIRTLSVTDPNWFKLFDYGPLVSQDWWALATGNTTVRVIEVERNS